ncbi:hypothetical protein RI129_002870 [Pyrocoelia pectoralis]|uniref:Uncharacterized protein n=1 Tax=Pyrocoelia pectoralis TaxID=417401 RepID=A0AAN7ZU96_9COLE
MRSDNQKTSKRVMEWEPTANRTRRGRNRSKRNGNHLTASTSKTSVVGNECQEQIKTENHKYKRQPDYCYYCETIVQNFVRHIRRNHSTEMLVAQIFSKPSNSKERRELWDKLRRKGNFLTSSQKSCKVVRKSIKNRQNLPCDNCLGLFSKKFLYRHRKKCFNGIINNKNAQAAGQAKLIINNRIDPQLKQQVFPRMRVDKVSLEAQNDLLICAFGSRYLKTHRELHFVNVTSRKMRELAKILIELKSLEPLITTMMSALRPEYFDLFVEASKRIAKYDQASEIYFSPTIAMNIATSLKQCCDIAITYAYKRDSNYLQITTAEAEAQLKTLIKLFETNWKFEVSTAAANNLNLNKWTKITIVPLASDLRLLKEYLLKIAADSIKILRNRHTFNQLIDSVYCRVILFNRKRSGELQRMLLHTYLNSSTEKGEYEEFNKVVSTAEQFLLKSIKRVVIRGKRGRGVPVLFSPDAQTHLQFLIEIRSQYMKENKYLFGKANSSSHIIGYKSLNKHAKLCGAKNPAAITSTRLRKHLATLSQLFNLSDQEIEQLSTFMGHTPGVHRNSYRLPDDVYQTAKISKLLMVMEKGGASEYQGKALEDININLNENLLSNGEESDESDGEDIFEETAKKPEQTNIQQPEIIIPKKGKIRTLVPWTQQQKKVVKEYFRKNIAKKKPPIRSECEKLKEIHKDLLDNKDWLKIKVFIQNQYTKK